MNFPLKEAISCGDLPLENTGFILHFIFCFLKYFPNMSGKASFQNYFIQEILIFLLYLLMCQHFEFDFSKVILSSLFVFHYFKISWFLDHFKTRKILDQAWWGTKTTVKVIQTGYILFLYCKFPLKICTSQSMLLEIRFARSTILWNYIHSPSVLEFR